MGEEREERRLMDDMIYVSSYRGGDEIAAMLWGLMQACVAARGVGL
jgi:hypothetical protein